MMRFIFIIALLQRSSQPGIFWSSKVSRSFTWLQAITLLILTVLAATAYGAGGTTRDYIWLLFLDVNGKTNEPPQVNAGVDQEVDWADGSTIFLDATVTDDPGDLITYSWSKLEGPGGVSFASPNAEDTNATFSAPGSYVLQLSASDGKLSSSSTVAITLALNNNAPQVNAGTDKIFNYPTLTVSLNATVSDDPGDILTYAWSKVSGPGSVSFSAPAAEDTQATFSISGVYTLKLSVSDGALSSLDQVKVTINNSAPVVNIFRDSIETSSNSVALAPEVTDATSGILSYQWSKESGPGSATFSPSNAVSSTVTLGQTGTYVLKLAANDGELTGSDTVTVVYQTVGKIDVIVAFGDSITVGFGDSDCIEGFAKACSGYTVRLAHMLAGAKNYAHSVTIWEEGKGGETSLGGLSRIQGIIDLRPGADQYLVQYGTNDAISDPPPSKAVFKSRMSSIAQKINSAAGNPQPVLARVPWAKGTRSYLNTAIQLYNNAVGELYNELSYIKIPPPDFYSHFESNPQQIWSYFMFDTHLPIEQRRVDDLHPRDTGYDAMANKWRIQLTQ